MRTRSAVLVLQCLGAVAALGARSIAAQGKADTASLAGPRPVDRILAIVGSKPILASHAEAQLPLAPAQGAKIPEAAPGRDAHRPPLRSPLVAPDCAGR